MTQSQSSASPVIQWLPPTGSISLDEQTFYFGWGTADLTDNEHQVAVGWSDSDSLVSARHEALQLIDAATYKILDNLKRSARGKSGGVHALGRILLDAAPAERGARLIGIRGKKKAWTESTECLDYSSPSIQYAEGRPKLNALSEYAGVPSLAETQASVGDKQTVPEFSDSPYPSGVGVNVALEMATGTDEVPGKLEAYLCLQWSGVWKTSESEEFNILVMESRHRAASPSAATGSCSSVEPTVDMTGHSKIHKRWY
ncbi:hypothetical protein QFC20_004842 [Naganishia adeliensis]|uniref:Uncharacterized protein n=1 Tax=Naganishia adeliensis TaxID=92952 RepID=A0ACC2VV07_9TREE|nr:hypothetical protein QFC20_004842 [Naganishia adeliensis]